MKIGSIICLVLGLVFFAVASTQFGKTEQGPVLTDEQIQQQASARQVLHGARVPGAEVSQEEVAAAQAAQAKFQEDVEKQAATRRMIKLVLQGLGGAALLAGIILYVLDKRNE